MSPLQDNFEKNLTLRTPQQLGQDLLANLSSFFCDELKVLELIAAGANIEEKDDSGETPLMWAARRGHTKSVRALLEAGAVVDQRNSFGNSALTWAACSGNAEDIRALLDKGAAIDQKNDDGAPPLIWAAFNGNKENVIALLERGAAVDLEDSEGKTVIDWAKGHVDVVDLLKTEHERLCFVRAAAEREREDFLRAHEAWVKAGMPVDGVKIARPLKLKKKGCRP